MVEIRWIEKILNALIVGGTAWLLAACGSTPMPAHEPASSAPAPAVISPSKTPTAAVNTTQSAIENEAPPTAAPIQQNKSRWIPVRWADLPGFREDAIHEAWNAWLQACQRPSSVWQQLCADVRKLSIADGDAQRAWMLDKLQPYRVDNLNGNSEGMLTGYYEPVLAASRRPTATQRVALWQPPANLAQRKPWYSRKEIDTLPEAQALLRGKEIAYLDDPVDALVLQIQGSGKLRITEPDGSERMIRVAFAGTNEQPYRSVGRWLLDQNLIRDASWPGIKAWIAANSAEKVQDMLWSNPRMVFFKDEALVGESAVLGPRGAQGVPLTASRSIAVDRESIPLGTPVWLSSSGDAVQLNRLVLAQDVGSAILGGVRADYYVGSGVEAGEIAGRLKQPLKLWVLWPK